MMEAEEIIVGHAVQIGEAAADVRCILRDGIAACRCTIEADTLRVGTIVIGGVPQRRWLIADPRTRAIMMIARHLMGEAERSHVIDYCLPRVHHHGND